MAHIVIYRVAFFSNPNQFHGIELVWNISKMQKMRLDGSENYWDPTIYLVLAWITFYMMRRRLRLDSAENFLKWSHRKVDIRMIQFESIDPAREKIIVTHSVAGTT